MAGSLRIDSNRYQFLGVLESDPMATDDFFRARLDTMIDMRHPLVVLATRMPWADIEAALAPSLAHKDRSGRVVPDADLFGPTAQLAGAGLSNAGRPRLPLRLMVALLYLKHAFNLSDEELCDRWSENVVW
jgi:IS5 family transposase